MGLQIGGQKFDATLEVEGVWVNIAQSADGAGMVWWTDEEESPFDDDRDVGRILVARATNPKARAIRDKLTSKYRGARRTDGSMPPEIADRITREVIAKAVLRDWEDVAAEGHGETPYTPEVGLEMLSADTAFLEVVSSVAMAADIYRAECVKEDGESLGNS